MASGAHTSLAPSVVAGFKKKGGEAGSAKPPLVLTNVKPAETCQSFKRGGEDAWPGSQSEKGAGPEIRWKGEVTSLLTFSQGHYM